MTTLLKRLLQTINKYEINYFATVPKLRAMRLNKIPVPLWQKTKFFARFGLFKRVSPRKTNPKT
ncbi:MAG: hypothetical protein DRR19_24150 [Candidatus Parabeggiatoa sp. nov. 1]|nr:MAG: hypothetical protein DRR19_24150 [Gammaproteobacteria bacterium]